MEIDKTFLLRYIILVTAQNETNNCPYVELLRGRDGRDGRDGMPGATGPQGQRGEKGDSGGPQGPPGLTGAPGARGPVGPPGLTGTTGVPGPRGLPGTTGLTGATGAPGPRGLAGLTGLTGATGANGPAGPPGPKSGGVTYVRWGKSSCPNVTDTELLYAGRAAGTSHGKNGGGSNYLCMPDTPEYTLQYSIDHIFAGTPYSEIYGVEYEHPVVGDDNHDVPCAVCSASTRVGVLMIPARTSCPTGWTREYYGFLMAESTFYNHDHHNRVAYECVDKDQDSTAGTHRNDDYALFYHVEVKCNTGLPCPPYNGENVLNCVVCTK